MLQQQTAMKSQRLYYHMELIRVQYHSSHKRVVSICEVGYDSPKPPAYAQANTTILTSDINNVKK